MKPYKPSFSFIKQLLLVLITSLSIYSYGQELVFNEGDSYNPLTNYITTGESALVVSNKSFVELGIQQDTPPYTIFKAAVTLKVTPHNSYGVSGTPYDITLTILNNQTVDGIEHVDKVVHELFDYGVSVAVLAINVLDENNNPVVNPHDNPGNVYLKLWNEVDVVRPIELDPSYSFNIDTAGQEVSLTWQPVLGAVSYDVEWTWVDNYSEAGMNNSLTASQIPFSVDDFKHNSTRVNVTGTNYKLSKVHDAGFLIARVRAVGRFMIPGFTDQFKYSNWSSGIGAKVHVSDWNNIEVTAHENSSKNWQFQASYAEEGKKKEVVSYFDGTLRNRQTVTKINTNDNAVVGEVVYDAQGRPGVEILPVPIKNQHTIKYYGDFNLNIDGEKYSYRDFDTNTATACATPAGKMKKTIGSSKYYSDNNTQQNNWQDYVPDAKGYPFSQIEYTNDNTGRVKRKSGVGEEHQLETGHEMKYFYTTPQNIELQRLFGSEKVGNVLHYKKNIVIDPNKQSSVSYLDPQGRTIATALLANNPENLVPLEDEVNGDNGSFTTDILVNRETSLFVPATLNDALITSKEIISVTENSAYTFDYAFNTIVNDFEICDKNFPYVYDYKFNIKNSCSTLEEDTSVLATSTNRQYIVDLGVDNYTLTKTLAVSQDSLSSYTNQYNQMLRDPDINSACYVDPASFLPRDISFTSCLDICHLRLMDYGVEMTFYIEDGYTISCNGISFPSNGLTGNQNFLALQNNYVICSLATSFPTVTFTYVDDGEGNYNLTWPNDVLLNVVLVKSKEVELIEEFNAPIHYSYTHEAYLDAQITYVAAQTAEFGAIANFALEFEEGVAFSESACNPTQMTFDSCEINRAMMLLDMSLHGQYGEGTVDNTGVVTDDLSIFNENNGLPDNNASWRTPDTGHYYDEDGETSLILIEEDASGNLSPAINIALPANHLVEPQFLTNVADFLDNWKSSWAESLLKYHPEYHYLTYAERLCGWTNEIAIFNPSLGTSVETRALNSDEYESYINQIARYEDAVSAGLIGSSSDLLKKKDPYFYNMETDQESNLPDINNALTVTSHNLIMDYALGTKFNGMEVSISTLSTRDITMLEAAYIAVIDDGLSAYTASSFSYSDIENLSTSQKDRVWQTYRAFYTGLKAKIKYAEISEHEKLWVTVSGEDGYFNGCIGEPGGQHAADHYDVLSEYPFRFLFPQSIYGNDIGMCNLSADWSTKQKRFVPIDNLYDSSGSTQDTFDAMSQDAAYTTYVGTGVCPLAYDMEYFLDQLVKDQVSNSGSFLELGSSTITPVYGGQYITPDLYRAFGGSVPHSGGISISGAISGGNSETLTISLGGTNCNVNLTIPASFSQNWSDYQANSSTSGWNIMSFAHFYYDSFDATASLYSFQVLARVRVGATFKEVVLTGTTCVPVGECTINGAVSENGGENLGDGGDYHMVPCKIDANTSGGNNCDGMTCEEAVEGLLNYMLGTGSFYEDYKLGGDAIFFDTCIDDILSISPNTIENTTTTAWYYSYDTATNTSTIIVGTEYPNLVLIQIVFSGNLQEMGIDSFSNITASSVVINGNREIVISGLPCSEKGKIINNKSANCEVCIGYDSDLGLEHYLITMDASNCEPIRSVIFTLYGFTEISIAEGLTASGAISGETVSFVSSSTNNLNNGIIITADNPNGPKSTFDGSIHCTVTYANGTTKEFVFDSISRRGRKCTSTGDGDGNDGNDGSGSSCGFCITTTASSGRFNLEVSDPTCNNIDRLVVTISGSGIEHNSIHPSGFSCDSSSSSCTKTFTSFSIPNINGSFTGSAWELNVDCKLYLTDGTVKTINRSYNQDSPDLGQQYCSGEDSNSNNGGLEFEDEKECSCIPQTVAPVACSDAYTIFMEYMGNPIATNIDNGYGDISVQYPTSIAGYSLPSEYIYDDPNTAIIDGEDYFCRSNLAYLVADYKQYLNKMNIHSVADLGFITITQFGSTFFNYGYESIQDIVDDYVDYVAVATSAGIEVYSWNEYVDYAYNPLTNYAEATMPTGFTPAYLGDKICPPKAMDPMSISVPETNPCMEMVQDLANTYSNEAYEAYIASLLTQFRFNYTTAALANAQETLMMTYTDKEYQYTLYYYDQAGNLIQTVPPEGVDRLSQAEVLAETPTNHRLKTQYKYNSLNQLVWQKTPDGGETRFAYDDLGRIIASQNAKQKQIQDTTSEGEMSYTVYDGLGRIAEAGEIHYKANYTINDEGKLYKGALGPLNGFNTFIKKTEVSKTQYDTLEAGFSPIAQQNLRNRVAAVLYYETFDNSTAITAYENALFYSYDIHGNVYQMATRIPELASIGQDVKITNYDYDLISGNVHQVTYQKGSKDQFMHRYHYDADNRITDVQTSSDGVIWETDASYNYYDHGPLARTVIGDKQVQGQDYAYTLQGWLKAVNSEQLNTSEDMGKDGYNSAFVARDAFGYSLSYFSGDYKARKANEDTVLSITRGAFPHSDLDLYNGNIKTMVTGLLDLDQNPLTIANNHYKYDQLNRISSMDSHLGDKTMQTSYSYDRNGNLQTLKRDALKDSEIVAMDNFNYTYKAGTNQLEIVSDSITASSFTVDIDDQAAQMEAILGTAYVPGSPNYIYDKIGQLIEDVSEHIKIDWTVSGKVKAIHKNRGMGIQHTYFKYDALGNRINKSTAAEGYKAGSTSTYYLRDAQGNVLSIYKMTRELGGAYKYVLEEQNIYGSSRLGLQNVNKVLATSGRTRADSPLENGINNYNTVGDKRYELSNHLGNVLSVVTDRKLINIARGIPILIANFNDGREISPFVPTANATEVYNNEDNLYIEQEQTDGNYGDGDYGGAYTNVALEAGHDYLLKYDLVDDGGDSTMVRVAINAPSISVLSEEFDSAVGSTYHTHQVHVSVSNIYKLYFTSSELLANETSMFYVDNIELIDVTGMNPAVIAANSPEIPIFVPDVLSFNDYYPFGMLVPKRHDNSSAYRYGFNGMEKDDEVKGGNGNSYNFTFRMYDGRIGRFQSIDPLSINYPFASPYQYASNSPIFILDVYGLGPGPNKGWVRVMGTIKFIGGAVEAFAGAAGGAATSWTGIGLVAGGAAVIHGCDVSAAGLNELITGEKTKTLTEQGIAYGLEYAGVEKETAESVASTTDTALSIVLTAGASTLSATSKSGTALKIIDDVVIPTSNQAGAAGELTQAATYTGGKVAKFGAREFRTMTDYGKRVFDNIVGSGKNITAFESKVGYKTLSSGRGNSTVASQLAKDIDLLKRGEVQEVIWTFYKSPITGKVGASPKILKIIDEAAAAGLNIRAEIGELSDDILKQIMSK